MDRTAQFRTERRVTTSMTATARTRVDARRADVARRRAKAMQRKVETCSKFIRQSYLACLFALAQRAFCAAAILARASGENTRFFVMTGALPPDPPGPLL